MSGGLTQDQEKLVAKGKKLFHDVETDPELAKGMQDHGYIETVWEHGRGLFDTALSRGRARERAASNKLEVTRIANKNRKTAWRRCSRLANDSVTLFQGNVAYLKLLGLHQRYKNDSGTSEIARPDENDPLPIVLAWEQNLVEIAQSHTEIADILSKNGHPPEIVAACAAAVQELITSKHLQAQAEEAATLATDERNEAFKPFTKWLRCALRTAAAVRREKRQRLQSGALEGL